MIESNLELSREILRFMKKMTDKWTKKYNLNFSVLATPGEGISGRFCEDEETKEFYTNSFHIPVYLELDAFKKLELESNFVEYCNGGSISYIEFSTPVLNNSEAIMDVVKFGISKGINYLGIIKIDVLNKEYKFDVDSSDTNLTRIKALLFGIFFALTWSPCSGAYLAFAMNSALNTSTILEGRIPTFHICNGNSNTNAFSHNVYNKIKRYI